MERVAAGDTGLPRQYPCCEPQSMQAMERSHIIAILKKTHGVIEGPKGAARLLNMNASTTRFRIKKLGITRADYSYRKTDTAVCLPQRPS